MRSGPARGRWVGIVLKGLSVVIEMEGWETRWRTVPTESLKPFYTRSSDLYHSMEDEFAQLASRGGYSLSRMVLV